MSWRNRVTASLILLLLVSTFVAAFHHHENTADDHDCAICLVGHHQHATSPSTTTFSGFPFITETIYAAPAPSFADNIFITLLGNRAPPA